MSNETVTLNFAGQIKAVSILENYEPNQHGQSGTCEQLCEKATSTEAAQLCKVLQGVVDKLNKLCESIFAEHSEKIAGLSVEIARKVLMQKVQAGDYKIESVIQEALKNIPAREDVTVRLNPEDFQQYQKLQEENSDSGLEGVKFASDAGIARAECVVESPKGRIESLIEEHLEQIGKALTKAY